MSYHRTLATWSVAACLLLIAGCANETTETQRPVIDDDAPPTDVQQRHTGADEPQTGIGDQGAIGETGLDAPMNDPNTPTASESDDVDEIE